MSISLPRLATSSVCTALALAVVGGPSAALAESGTETLPSAASENAAAAAAKGAADAAAAVVPDVAADNAAPQAALGTPAGERAPVEEPVAPALPAQAVDPADNPQNRPAEPTTTAPDLGADRRAGADQQGRAEDPRGNNGTFKVDGPALDLTRGNEPHVTCEFRLNFFGYDKDQLATIVATLIPPTRGGSTTLATKTLISTVPAKGGLYDGSYPGSGSLDAGDLGVAGATEALHVKLSVESFNADGSEVPGGAKHKVFWLEPCAPGDSTGGGGTGGGGTGGGGTGGGGTGGGGTGGGGTGGGGTGGGGTGGGGTSVAVGAPAGGTTAALPVMGPVVPAALPVVPAVLPGAPAVTPVGGVVTQAVQAPVMGPVVPRRAAGRPAVAAAPAVGAAQVASRGSVSPTSLPFTGTSHLLVLLVGGIVSVAGGAGMVAAARRSA